jgi:hypothetical protein
MCFDCKNVTAKRGCKNLTAKTWWKSPTLRVLLHAGGRDDSDGGAGDARGGEVGGERGVGGRVLAVQNVESDSR